MEHLNKSGVEWNNISKMSEMALFFRLIIYNSIPSNFISFAITSLVFFIGYCSTKKDAIVQERVYCIVLLFLCSASANYIQMISCVLLMGSTLYEWNANMTYLSTNEMKGKMIQYFNIKIANAYLIFIIEWASSSLNMWSLPVILFVSFWFQVYAWMTTDTSNEQLDDYYFTLNKLPKNYPIPLDFTHALDHCNIIKKVFKPHQI